MKQFPAFFCLVALAGLALAACGQPVSPSTPTLPAPAETLAPTPKPAPPVTPEAVAPVTAVVVGSYSLAENSQKLLVLSPEGSAYWWDNHGTYTVSEDRITFVDVGDCTEPGVYQWSLEGTRMKLKPLDRDPCQGRYAKTLTWFVKQRDLPFVEIQRLTHGQELTSLAPDRQGNLYAVDQSTLTILKLDLEGRLLTTFGGKGAADGQFASLGTLVVDGRGYLYAADTAGKRVIKFDATGSYLGTLELPSLAGPGPLGLAVDGQDNLYVGLLGIQDHYVEKWSAGGKQLASWGSRGTGDGQFGSTGPNSGPRGIAVDRQGNVYVADPENNRVQEFDASGRFLRSLAGCGAGDFVWPFSLAVDAAGNLYVLDGLGHLFECDVAGRSLGVWLAPWGNALRLDAAGRLYLIVAGDIARIELPAR
jgi:hypothetical protein